MARLILASASPRRLEILRSLGLDPEVRPMAIDESPLPGEAPEAAVLRLAREKASRAATVLRAERGLVPPPPIPSKSVTDGSPAQARSGADPARAGPPLLILGADTSVILDGEILGKPSGPEEAVRMLTRLSGRTHEVLTAVAVLDPSSGREETGVSRTVVRFAKLSREEIASYVATGEPMDKAGAYGIQDRGGRFVEGTEGSYTNVVGLPIELFCDLLVRFGLTVETLSL